MSWLDTIFKFTPLQRRNSITPNVQDGATCEAQCDAEGRILVSTESPNAVWSDGAANASQRVVKNSSGKVYQVFGRNTAGAARYLFVYDAAVKPADGSTAHIFTPVKVEAGLAFSLTLPRPRKLTNGLTWVVSTSDITLTYDASGAFQVAVEYE